MFSFSTYWSLDIPQEGQGLIQYQWYRVLLLSRVTDEDYKGRRDGEEEMETPSLGGGAV